MGLVSALFVIVLAATGLLIQHSPALGLDSSRAGSGLLLWIYGIEVPEITASYSLAGTSASLIGDAVYLGETRIIGNYAGLTGIVDTEFGYAIATASQLVLVTAEGELVEVLGSAVGVPGSIDSLGKGDDGSLLLLRVDEILRFDLDALAAVAAGPESALGQVRWSVPVDLPDASSERIRQDYAATLLSWERVILDLHSGRVFGSFGVLLMDLMALLFLFMAITGVWIWSRRRS